MAPTPDPRDAVMARAIEKTRGHVEQIIAEARERQCFVYKGHADVRSHIITLHFTNLIAGDQFSRVINCFSNPIRKRHNPGLWHFQTS